VIYFKNAPETNGCIIHGDIEKRQF